MHNNKSSFTHQTKLQKCWENWQLFWRIYHRYHRLNDLEQLIEWASRKRLGVRYYYQELFLDENQRQFRDKIASPWVNTWAHRLYQVSLCLPEKQDNFGSGHAYKYSREYILNTY